MDLTPAISIIMPVYKTDKEFLKESIESVLNQTFKNFEFIIINSSQDECEDLILSYDDNRIKYLVQAKCGQSKARNIGLNLAKGKYIYYIDADDWIPLETFEKLYQKSEEYNYDILISNAIYYNNNTKECLDWMVNLNYILREDITYNISNPEIHNNLFVISGTPWGKLYKRNFLIENKLFFIENMIFEDLELFFRYMVKASRIGIILDKLYYYRNLADNTSTSMFDERHFGVIKAVNLIEQTLIENNLFEKLKIRFYDYKYGLIRFRYENFSQELKEKFVPLVKEDLKTLKLNPREFKKLKTNDVLVQFFDNIQYNDPRFTSR